MQDLVWSARKRSADAGLLCYDFLLKLFCTRTRGPAFAGMEKGVCEPGSSHGTACAQKSVRTGTPRNFPVRLKAPGKLSMQFNCYDIGEFFDEMFGEAGQPRASARTLFRNIQGLPDGELLKRQRALNAP